MENTLFSLIAYLNQFNCFYCVVLVANFANEIKLWKFYRLSII